MIRPVVDALVARVPVDMRAAAKALVQELSDAQAVEALKAGWGVTADAADIARRMEAQRQARANGHQGGVKTARKRLMGLLPTVDPAGAKWKPDHTGKLDKTIFPKWGRFPVYIPPLVEHMTRVQLATVVLIGEEEVDRRGRFKLPRAAHARRAGCSEGKAYAALQTFEAAGLIRADIPAPATRPRSGATAPWPTSTWGPAIRVLQGVKRAARQAAEAMREKARHGA